MSFYTSRYQPYGENYDDGRVFDRESRLDTMPSSSSFDTSLRSLRDGNDRFAGDRYDAPARAPMRGNYDDIGAPGGSAYNNYGRQSFGESQYGPAMYETPMRREPQALGVYGDRGAGGRYPSNYGYADSGAKTYPVKAKQAPLRVPHKVDRAEPKPVTPRKAPPNFTAAKTIAQQLKRVGDFPVIGLKFVTEFVTEYDDGKSIYFYRCNLCAHSGDARQIMIHILDYQHRTKYIEHFKLEPANDKKDVERRSGAIETVHGRGQWAVQKEKKQFISPAIVKKAVAEALGDKKAMDKEIELIKKQSVDVDMKDDSVPTFPQVKTPRKRRGADDGTKLRDGEKVIEEISIEEDEPIVNPQLFVLSYLNDLVSKDFSISSEDELTIVDSIITSMRKAVVGFQSKRNSDVDHQQGLLDLAESDVVDELLAEDEAMPPAIEEGDEEEDELASGQNAAAVGEKTEKETIVEEVDAAANE